MRNPPTDEYGNAGDGVTECQFARARTETPNDWRSPEIYSRVSPIASYFGREKEYGRRPWI